MKYINLYNNDGTMKSDYEVFKIHRNANKRLPANFIDTTVAKNIIRGTIENKDVSIEDLLANSDYVMRKLKMSTIANRFFGSYRTFILETLKDMPMCGHVEEWHFKVTSSSIWDNHENVKKYVKEILILNNLNTKEEIKENLRYTMFDYRLQRKYTVIEILEIVFPGEYKAWDLRELPSGFWRDKSNVKNYFKWLFKKYNWTEEDVKNNFATPVITKQSILYHYTLTDIIKLLYPNSDIKEFTRIQHCYSRRQLRPYKYSI